MPRGLMPPGKPEVPRLVTPWLKPFVANCDAARMLRRLAVASGTRDFAERAERTLAAIAAEPLIGFAVTGYPEYHLWITELFASTKRAPQIKEEHESVTSLIAAVEACHGVALVLEPFRCFTPRVKIRAVNPPPPPLAVGVAYLKDGNSAPAEKLVGALKRATAIGE